MAQNMLRNYRMLRGEGTAPKRRVMDLKRARANVLRTLETVLAFAEAALRRRQIHCKIRTLIRFIS